MISEKDDVGDVCLPPSSPENERLSKLGLVNQLLWLWILLAMALGVILGYFVPNTSKALQKGEFVGVSIPILVGLLVMMYPILCKVQYEEMHLVVRDRKLWVQIAFSVVSNWIVSPLVMCALAWAFLPDKEALRQGLLLVGTARCIAMVLIWNDLAFGEHNYCAILVAFNSILQIVLYAPMAKFYITYLSSTTHQHVDVAYSTVAKSVAVFLGIPFGAAVLTRFGLRNLIGAKRYDDRFIPWISPLSLLGLLFTIIILFASQGRRVVEQIVIVVRVSAPLIVYFLIIFSSSMFLCRKFGFNYKLTVTQSFTAASNNFELAIAVAVAIFGISSDQALAATVGPLIEVPVLLLLVHVTKWFFKPDRNGTIEGESV